MPKAESRASVVWKGSLVQGEGTLNLDSGVMTNQPVTWASRTQRSKGKTSPEELLAGAHAACYAMAFSHALAEKNTPPTRLAVSATCTFDQVDGKFKITTIELDVVGEVPGLDQPGFEEVARAAEGGCPVSNALRGNVEIRLKPQLV